jgi:hypothetical protein
MRAIGFRASPDEVIFNIIDCVEDQSNVIANDKIKIPVSLSFPEKLNYLRKTVRDILFEFNIERAGIRVTESTAQTPNITRISFEAILQELICGSTVEKYFVGQIAHITGKLGIDRKDFKKIAESKEINTCKDIDLSKFNGKQREAILVALASLNL